MNYQVLHLMLCGLFGILVHTLMKINSINRKSEGNFKFSKFIKIEWASIFISISIVIVALIARGEVQQLKEIGDYLMLGFFCIGLASQSIAYFLSNKLEKKIELDSKNNNGNEAIQNIIINEVDILPTKGIIGQWYHFGNNYYYWNGNNWVALYEDFGPGGSTNPPPTGLPPIKP